MKKRNQHSNAEQVEAAVDLQIFLKKPFRLILTNYTAKIESDFFPTKTVDQPRNPRFFVAAKMVERDCKMKEKPNVQREYVKYNDFNISGEIFLEEIFGVDITSAYASILCRDGYLSKKTYGYLSRLPKEDRLGAVGAMAAKKNIFQYNEKGEIETFEEAIKETENYFYYCVQKTAEAMANARAQIKEGYLFTWVDCIYFTNKEDVEKVVDSLKKDGLKCKTKKYTQFLVVKRKKGSFFCTFVDEENEVKSFFIPAPHQKIRNSITRYLLNKQEKIK